MHRLDLLAKLLDLRATDHPTTGPVILGDDASEENYELDAVLEAIVRLLFSVKDSASNALMHTAMINRDLADVHNALKVQRDSIEAHDKALAIGPVHSVGCLDAVHAYVKEAGL